jgi:transcriptional regulator with XRE-family HTH domain
MEAEMKLDPSSVRRLREARNWSQEQLAAASGLSLRTIQRVESEGAASRETRVCLAAALDVDTRLLSEARQEASPMNRRYPQFASAMASTLVGVTMLAAALLSDAPKGIHYLAGIFLLAGGLEFAYRSLRPPVRPGR